MTTYVFRIEVAREADGSWLASVPSLPGCVAEGASRDDAIDALNETAQAFAEVLIEDEQRQALVTASLMSIDSPTITLEI
jgi:predicted RNase H-like HicB family nuclease